MSCCTMVLVPSHWCWCLHSAVITTQPLIQVTEREHAPPLTSAKLYTHLMHNLLPLLCKCLLITCIALSHEQPLCTPLPFVGSPEEKSNLELGSGLG